MVDGKKGFKMCTFTLKVRNTSEAMDITDFVSSELKKMARRRYQ